MVELLRVEEGEPANFPMFPTPAGIMPEAVWRRIEHWIAYRWNERAVTWHVAGAGDWTPPLRPYTVDQAYQWNGGAYEAVTLADGPLGLWLEGGQYKVTATVGDTDKPPSDVEEACKRLAEYWAQNGTDTGLTSVTDGDFAFTRSASAMARAVQYSGCADLLRRYR